MKSLKIFFVFGIIVLLLGILLGCEERVVEPKPQELDQRIVFYSNRTDSTEVFVMDQDGRNQQQVTPSGLDLWIVGEPLWSPDKEKIAFTSYLEISGYGIMLINSDGTGLDTLVSVIGLEGEHFELGDYSSDGNQITYSYVYGMPPFFSKVSIISTDGTGKLELDNGENPRFCGNNKVVYSYWGDIFIIGTDGTGKEQLTINPSGVPATYHLPVGSPDGKKVAFGVDIAIDSPDHYALGIVNSDGSGDTVFAYERYICPITEIEFSPDAQRILFLNGDKAYVRNVDGTGLDSLTGGIACANGGASWSPDEEWIVFTSNRDGNKNIYKVRTDGSRTFVQLTDDPADDFSPDW